MSDEFLLGLSCTLFHHRNDHCNSSADAASRGRFGAGQTTRDCAVDCRIRTPPRDADSPPLIWNSDPIYDLAEHLLVLFGDAVFYLGSLVLLHARLSQHKSRGSELLWHALQHLENGRKVS